MKTSGSSFDPDLRTPLHEEMLHWVNANKDGIWQWAYSRLPKQTLYSRWQECVRQDHGRGPVLGCVDMIITDGRPEVHSESPVMVDVRTKIANLGETIREINFCKSGYVTTTSGLAWRVRDYPYVLVSPDNFHEATLKEQKIVLFKYARDFQFPVAGGDSSSV